MKKIDAIIKSFRLEAVKEALCGIGVEGVTVTQVWGFGRQMGRAELSGGPGGAPSLMPKVRLEMVVRDDDVGPILEVLARTANTGQLGDGKIFVAPILDAVRIRTSERGEAAVHGPAQQSANSTQRAVGWSNGQLVNSSEPIDDSTL